MSMDNLLGRAAAWGETDDCLAGDGSFFARAEYDRQVWSMLFVAIAAMPTNVYLVYGYLFQLPPHPKFLLLPRYRFCIRLHVGSGVLEIFAGIAMWFSRTHLCTRLHAVISVVHALTSLYQVPLLFGMKLFMNPAYITAILIKGYLAVNVMVHPHCYVRALSLVVIHSTYAWVRNCHLFMNYFGIVQDSKYTMSVMFAGFITTPVIEPWLNLLLILAIVSYACYLVTFASKKTSVLALTENSRCMFSNKPGYEGLKCPFSNADVEADELPGIATENSKAITYEELMESAKVKGDPLLATMLEALFDSKSGASRTLDSKELCRILDLLEKPFHSVTQQDLDMAEKPEDRARCVFNALDDNGDGTIEVRELAAVILHFGMPPRHVQEIMDNFDDNRDGTLDFSEFFRHFQPLWEFAFWDLSQGIRNQKFSEESAEERRMLHKACSEEYHQLYPALLTSPHESQKTTV